MDLARLVHTPSLLSVAAAALLVTPHTRATDPIVQTCFTADPAPLVHDGVVYLYTSHDEDDAPPGQGRFRMLDWKCYASTDMANWTDLGTVASLATFPWAVQSNDAWAPQVVERAGKFYLYVPISVAGSPKNVIAVAVADNPRGPFKDALGRPLIEAADGYIDPTVFVDDDGQAYLFFGNPHLWYVKLNDDMVSCAGPIVREPTKPENYQEGPWFYKRAGHYYLAYASTCCPEGIGYAMSDRPTGPWTYQGYIVPPDRRSTGNHPGIVDYKGTSYVFGFNYKLNFAITDQHHERRSVCVAKLDYNPDGTIRELPWWEESPSVAQLGALDPYRRVEGETICWSEGIKTAANGQSGLCVFLSRDRAYLKVQGADLAGGASRFRAAVAAAGPGAQIEIHLDQPTGPLIGTCAIPDTGSASTWTIASCPLRDAAGRRDVFLVFTGVAANSPRLDWWQVE